MVKGAQGFSMNKEISDFADGTLHSGSGDIVMDVAQARAIAFSESRRAKKR